MKEKIYQLLLNIFLFFAILFFLGNSSFAFVGEMKGEEIKKVKESTSVLKKENVINFSIFEKFKKDNQELTSYFKENLSKENLLKIEKIITEYNKKKKNIGNNVNKNQITELIQEKKEFYNSFLEFVGEDKILDYKKFINKKIENFTLVLKQKTKEEIQHKRILSIKEKIKKNHKQEEKKLRDILKAKIKLKLYNLKNSKRIASLPIEKQIFIFKNVEAKIYKLKHSNIKFTKKQLEILNIMGEIISEIIKSYKK